MAAVIAYTLLIMHLVCHLVASANPVIDVTDSVTTQSPPQHQATSLPAGYVAYPDIGFAYKFHHQETTWIEARNVCVQNGAHLAVIDSVKKVEYIAHQMPPAWVHAGVIRMDGDTWSNINTGVSAPSTIWRPNEISRSGNCSVLVSYKSVGLTNIPCEYKAEFLCELPIPVNSTIATVN